MPKKTRNKYNHYTEDFRHEAVRRADDPKTSAAEVRASYAPLNGRLGNTHIHENLPRN